MTEKLRQFRAKQIITWVTVVALGLFTFALRHQILDSISNLRDVNIFFVLLIAPLEALNHFSDAKMYQYLFRILGDRFRTKSMVRLSLELNFVNTVFPSGGVSGFSYISVRMRPENISGAKSTLVQMMRFVLIFVSFQIFLILGLLLLAIGGHANELAILVAGSLATLLLIATLAISFIIGSKQRINSFFTFITRLINRLIHVIRRGHPETINIARAQEVFTELHEHYMHIRRNLDVLRKPLLFSLLANFTEMASIFAVYVAFGHFVNPGAIILAYAIANFAGLISVLPGGVGIYEALMTAVMTAGGVPASLSLPVTIMYRVVNMSVQLPPGYLLYHRALNAEPIQPDPPVHIDDPTVDVPLDSDS